MYKITANELARFNKMFNHIKELYGDVDLELFRY